MRVKYMQPFNGMTGRLEGLVYYVDKITGATLCREYVKPTLATHNFAMGERSTNIGRFYHAISSGYLSDLKNYSDRLNLIIMGHGSRYNANSTLIKLLYALARAVPSVDLCTLTPEEVVESELPIRTVREAIENGLIPIVPRYLELCNGIV